MKKLLIFFTLLPINLIFACLGPLVFLGPVVGFLPICVHLGLFVTFSPLNSDVGGLYCRSLFITPSLITLILLLDPSGLLAVGMGFHIVGIWCIIVLNPVLFIYASKKIKE